MIKKKKTFFKMTIDTGDRYRCLAITNKKPQQATLTYPPTTSYVDYQCNFQRLIVAGILRTNFETIRVTKNRVEFLYIIGCNFYFVSQGK